MIKYCSILVCFWLLWPALSVHAQFTDNFEDGDFTSNPEWSGDDANFVVETEILRLMAPTVTDTSYLSTSSTAIDNAIWEFWVRLDFSPSGNNYAEVFLVSNQSNVAGALDGYFVRIGDSDDDVSLYRKDGNSSTKIIDGTDGFVDMSDVMVRIQVTRDDAGNWELLADNSGGTTYQSMGSVLDDTYFQTNFFGVLCKYTSSRSDKFYFDDISVSGDPFVDDIPPTVESVEVLSSNQLLAVFSEPVSATAENIANYNLSPDLGAPTTAEFSDGSTSDVELLFGSEMVNGTNYTLSVENVEDLSSNTMDDAEIEFLFVIPETAEFKDVVINEIMPDPNPVIGNLPEEEYLEIYNVSDKYIELENWELLNSGNPTTFPSFLLEPGQHVIVCGDDDAAAFGAFGTVVSLSSFAALTNGGDDLVLNNANGTLIDAVTYSDDWYGDPEKTEGGWSLELINPETPCSGSQNWIASNDPNGGTPGAQNSVYDTTPDTTPPALVGYTIADPQNILLFFNEPLDPESIDDALVTIDPPTGLADISVTSDNLSVQLVLDAPIDTAVSYTVTIENITDCIGNPIGEENNIEFVIGYTPQQYDVLINEIMADPTPEVGLPDQEYIELFNTTDQLFDLSNCQISGNAFAPNTFIQPNQHLLLVSSESFEYPDAEAVAVMPDLSSSFLTNSGRELLFLNEQSETIDRVNYSIDWYRDADKTDGGWSLERINPEEPCRGGDNWRASNDQSGGTPGLQNSVFSLAPDETAPQLEYILVIDSVTIELVFDEVLDESTVISAGYSFEPELTVFDIGNVPPSYQRIRLTFSETLTPNQRHEITIFGLADCTGNEYENEDDVAFGRPDDPTSGNLILNEVLFNERTGGSDYVEIYNYSNAIISLQDWQLGNLGNDQYDVITDTPFILFPGEYLAITEDKLNVLTEYPFAPAGRVFQADDIPTLNNSEGMVVLIDPEGETTDRFDYNEDMHFALLNDLDGISLERIGFDRPSNDPTNWMSAAEEFNWGTPGFENSQFQPAGEPDDDVVVEPEIFSPDNDGYQDVLNINYQFDRSGLAGNITIYDASGREIRQLMRNDLLGSNGTISWDGTTDDGNRARVGIHVIFVEVFGTEGYKKSYKLSCVVASRF